MEEGDFASSQKILSTGRVEVIMGGYNSSFFLFLLPLLSSRVDVFSGLPEEDRQYIAELRVKVLHLLDSVYVTLYGISPENLFFGLRSSTDIHKTWMKVSHEWDGMGRDGMGLNSFYTYCMYCKCEEYFQVLFLLVTRRMSFLKDVNQTKKYLDHSKRVGL
jgi:hypothetical protein